MFKYILIIYVLAYIQSISGFWSQEYGNSQLSSFEGHPIINEMVLSHMTRINQTINYNPIYVGGMEQSYLVPNVSERGVWFEKYSFNGKKEWESNMIFPNSTDGRPYISFSFAAKEDQVIVLSHELGRVYGLKGDNGNLLWSSSNSSFYNCSFPTIIDNELMLWCFQEGRSMIYHIDSSNGNVKHTLAIPSGNPKTVMLDYHSMSVYFDSLTSEFSIVTGPLNPDHQLGIQSSSNLNSDGTRTPALALPGTDAIMSCAYGSCILLASCVNNIAVLNRYYFVYRTNSLIDYDCNLISNLKFSRTMDDNVFFGYNKFDTYTNSTRFVIGKSAVNVFDFEPPLYLYNSSNEQFLDLALTKQPYEDDSYLYICTNKRILMIFLSEVEGQSIKEYSFNDDFRISECKLAVGLNQLIVNTVDQKDNNTVILRLRDSICTTPCSKIDGGGSFKCTNRGCDCQNDYYPSGVCTNYCPKDYCYRGVCGKNGECECYPQFKGPRCQECIKFYIGENCNLHVAWVATVVISGVLIVISSTVLLVKFLKDKDEEQLKYSTNYQAKILEMEEEDGSDEMDYNPTS